ncbi:MAG TPA: OsmC family protein [Casimicrobiaceae bacterium]|nr:OsmC family protein [Casimicrobiaceae bacterium]
MTTRVEGIVRQRQDPLRKRYRSDPAEAWIDDQARTLNACDTDPFHGAVVPANGGDAPLRFGVHRAVGGFHDYPNPGDLLCAALAACLDSTLRIVADRLAIRLGSLHVDVTAECDVRGCLQVDPAVPVGFQRMRCRVRLRPRDEIDENKMRMLVAVAESCCVVLQTLRNGVAVQAEVEPSAAAVIEE